MEKNAKTQSFLPYPYRGVIVPVFTPFKENTLEIDLSVIPTYAKYLVDRGIRGVLVNGTSGEGPLLSVAERKSLASAWAEVTKATDLHLMVQVGGAPLPDVLELTCHADEIEADSVLCLPDLYFKPTNNDQLINYLKIVGQSAPRTPLLYYHIPMFTNVNLNMRSFLESIGNKVPSFVGIKFTSTNLEEGSQAVRACGGQYRVFLGSDQIISAGGAVGMDSFIPTSANIFPALLLSIPEASRKGNANEAAKRQEELSKAVVAISKHGHWVETMKAAMSLLTPVKVGPPRMPLSKLSEDKVEIIRKDLAKLQLAAK